MIFVEKHCVLQCKTVFSEFACFFCFLVNFPRGPGDQQMPTTPLRRPSPPRKGKSMNFLGLSPFLVSCEYKNATPPMENQDFQCFLLKNAVFYDAKQLFSKIHCCFFFFCFLGNFPLGPGDQQMPTTPLPRPSPRQKGKAMNFVGLSPFLVSCEYKSATPPMKNQDFQFFC